MGSATPLVQPYFSGVTSDLPCCKSELNDALCANHRSSSPNPCMLGQNVNSSTEQNNLGGRIFLLGGECSPKPALLQATLGKIPGV